MIKGTEGFVNYIIFDDEITLYWDKEWDLPDGVIYSILLNNSEIAKTPKTHFEIYGLNADTDYTVAVARLDCDKGAEVLFEEVIHTEEAKQRIDVTKPPYNAVGDGKTLNTQALQRALGDCQKNQAVYFPAGIYMTGALDVHSDTEIYLDEDAVLQGTAEVSDYAPKINSRFEGKEMMCYRPLINMGIMDKDGGYTCKNISIRGGGTVSGGGEKLCWAVIESERERLKDFLAENEEYVKTCENNDTIPGRARPRLVSMNNCKDIVLSNITFQYGAAWNVHFVYSKNIVTYGCTIKSKGVWNGDGWDPDSSEDCTIFATKFDTHDDAIAIKSGKNPEGNIINRPTKNIRIFDCQGPHGIAMGSELSGGIEGVFIWDSDFSQGETGIRAKTTRKRGGYVRNVRVKNCKVVEIRFWTGYTCNDDGEPSGELTVIEDLYFENIKIKGISNTPDGRVLEITPILLEGFDNEERYIKNVVFKNIMLPSSKEREHQHIELKNIKNVTFENISYYNV